MIPIYYTLADDMMEFATVDAIADWIAQVDDRIAIISADLPDHTVQILLGDPRDGATVKEFTAEGVIRVPLFTNRIDAIRHWLDCVRRATE